MAQKRNQVFRIHIPTDALSMRATLHQETDTAVIMPTNSNSNSKVNSATNMQSRIGFLQQPNPEYIHHSELSSETTTRCHGDFISNTTRDPNWGPYFKSRANFVDLHVS
ncbi:uncharacterized protein LOC117294934 [Asterias rubens]|uniref:uncharacterized protein LOC117294934 n=1 Tax=Asterias rubens TaxID=7604 RepID=UPI001455178D|nr:uncharacterized protein LOC117294934 [Asterias rubens]